ncbi:CPXCG motif-containing cysteine-rich protein [Aureibaculum conchae]|uniref:CPXCG motif-containing cysteine-rich protein n=1 Tax=Aureibaculum sp. 2308TA14-22 TaxID=3108392 RepID=UPI0033925B84
MLEHFFQCPCCWEEISILLDNSISNTTYIEDCEVCCRPIEINISFDFEQNLENFSAVYIEQ